MFVFHTLITHFYAIVRRAAVNGRGSNYKLIINLVKKVEGGGDLVVNEKLRRPGEAVGVFKDASEHQGELEDF